MSSIYAHMKTAISSSKSVLLLSRIFKVQPIMLLHDLRPQKVSGVSPSSHLVFGNSCLTDN